jgi:transposase
MTTVAEYTEENYETRRVSNFLDWAHKKLNEEVKQIEEMEAEYGTAVWHKKPNKQRGVPALSLEEKQKLVGSVDELRANGMTAKEACAKFGKGYNSYCKYRKDLGLPPYKPGWGRPPKNSHLVT